MMPTQRIRAAYAALLVIALVSTLACAAVTPVSQETSQSVAVAEEASATPTVPTETAPPTASPTATQRPTRTATPAPSGSPTPLVARGLSAFAAATPQAGQRVSVAISAEELNDAFTLGDLQVQGAEIGDPAITLGENVIVGRFAVTVKSPAMTLDVILRGVPNVVGGALFLQVEDVSLGEGTGFLARLLAQPMVDSTIREYSGENGIPVPLGALQDLKITDATVTLGVLTIEGLAR